MNKKGLIGIIIVTGILLVVGFFWFVGEADLVGETEEEMVCVPASCCHATECVLEGESPNCSGMGCTMVCSGPLDCGAGRCEYVNGECEVVRRSADSELLGSSAHPELQSKGTNEGVK